MKNKSICRATTVETRHALSLLLFLLTATPQVFSQSKIDADSIRSKMQWFADAKLGIFIHWGIYAVNGIGESWSFHNRQISWADYMNQMKGFTASKYNPEEWAALIKESGAKYAVITTKHHDGVALWATKQHHFNVVNNTPAKRDLLTPFYKALDKEGIKKGAYFSLIDWSYPDYPGFLKDSSRYKIADNPKRWQKFLNFYEAQINEVEHNFHPDLWWFDGDWEHSAEEWEATKVRKMILDNKPAAIINGRLQGYGDYDTPEQNFPVTRPHFNWWELCMTINSNWGYQPTDTDWKTPYEIITIFADAVSNGGNLLLDIGPKPDGTIPAEQVHVLKELGKWNKKNGEAIFATDAGLPLGHFYGPTTLSKDSSTLYLFLAGNVTGDIMVKGLKNKINKIRVLGTNETLQHKVVGKISWSEVPGIVYIQVPEKVQDEYMTVLALELDGPVKLYRGKGGFLTN
ncbi:MAG: alpha-L-fucosidase [Ferruginibacter sp.]